MFYLALFVSFLIGYWTVRVIRNNPKGLNASRVTKQLTEEKYTAQEMLEAQAEVNAMLRPEN